jgi:hypothetical protein
VIASVVLVAVFARYVRPSLNLSNGHYLVLGSLVGKLCRAKLVSGPSCHVIAVDVGFLSLAATRPGPGCHAANTSHAICVRFLYGPLNSLVGSAIEHAIVVFAGWVAWRLVLATCNRLQQRAGGSTSHFSCALSQRPK